MRICGAFAWNVDSAMNPAKPANRIWKNVFIACVMARNASPTSGANPDMNFCPNHTGFPQVTVRHIIRFVRLGISSQDVSCCACVSSGANGDPANEVRSHPPDVTTPNTIPSIPIAQANTPINPSAKVLFILYFRIPYSLARELAAIRLLQLSK